MGSASGSAAAAAAATSRSATARTRRTASRPRTPPASASSPRRNRPPPPAAGVAAPGGGRAQPAPRVEAPCADQADGEEGAGGQRAGLVREHVQAGRRRAAGQTDDRAERGAPLETAGPSAGVGTPIRRERRQPGLEQTDIQSR